MDKTKDIPEDYYEAIGVPITFLDKYNPDEFEIVRFRKGDDGKDLVYVRPVDCSQFSHVERERETSAAILPHHHSTPKACFVGLKPGMDTCAINSITAMASLVSPSHSLTDLTLLSSKSADAPIPTEIRDVTMTEQLSMLVSPDIMSTNASSFEEDITRVLIKRYGYSESELTYCSGVIGVPITFLDKFNPNDFVILGISNSARYIGDIECYAIIDGRKIYNRILIRRK